MYHTSPIPIKCHRSVNRISKSIVPFCVLFLKWREDFEIVHSSVLILVLCHYWIITIALFVIFHTDTIILQYSMFNFFWKLKFAKNSHQSTLFEVILFLQLQNANISSNSITLHKDIGAAFENILCNEIALDLSLCLKNVRKTFLLTNNCLVFFIIVLLIQLLILQSHWKFDFHFAAFERASQSSLHALKRISRNYSLCRLRLLTRKLNVRKDDAIRMIDTDRIS